MTIRQLDESRPVVETATQIPEQPVSHAQGRFSFLGTKEGWCKVGRMVANAIVVASCAILFFGLLAQFCGYFCPKDYWA